MEDGGSASLTPEIKEEPEEFDNLARVNNLLDRIPDTSDDVNAPPVVKEQKTRKPPTRRYERLAQVQECCIQI